MIKIHKINYKHIVFSILQATKYILIGSKKCLNLATHNYLGFIGNEEIEKQTTNALYKYGVGSSGPRGFYGTMGRY